MTTILNWFGAKRWRLSLSHCAEGLIIQAPMTLLLGYWAGAASVVVWYWSRKKLEVEMKQGHDTDPTFSWSYGWFPWEWDKYYVLDVALPAASSFLIAYILSVL
jgi:hypothetical protein